MLVMLRKGYHSSEVQVRGAKEKLCSKEKDSLERALGEAEIQHKDLSSGKNLAFSKDTGLEKERM